MPYKPIRGGSIYNRKLAALTAHNRHVRQIIQTIIETGATREQLNQYLVAITLISTKIDDLVADLRDFDDKPTDAD